MHVILTQKGKKGSRWLHFYVDASKVRDSIKYLLKVAFKISNNNSLIPTNYIADKKGTLLIFHYKGHHLEWIPSPFCIYIYPIVIHYSISENTMVSKFCLFPPLMILTLTFSYSFGKAQSEVKSSNEGILYASPPPPNECPYSCLPPPTPTDCPPPPPSPQLPTPPAASPPPPSGPVYYPPPSGYHLPPGGYFFPPPVYEYGPPPPNPILPYLPFYYKNPPPPSDYSSAASHYGTIKRMNSKLLILVTLFLGWFQ